MGHPKLSGDALDRRFMRLACTGPRRQLSKLLAAYPHLLESRWDGRTALTEACRWPDRNHGVEVLLAAGADPNASRPDDPQFRPLRLALRSCPHLVPALLEHGARVVGPYPGRYLSDSQPDLVVAAQHCPEHIPALLAAGAGANDKLEHNTTALGTLLLRLAQERGDSQEQVQAQWRAVAALVEAGAGICSDSPHHANEWHLMWHLRFSNQPIPAEARASLDLLQARMEDPGQRFSGGSFLHTIARCLRVHGRGARQLDAWEALLSQYDTSQLSQWLDGADASTRASQTIFDLLVPEIAQDSTLGSADAGCDRLVDALEWAKTFQALGGDPNASNAHQRTMARSIALNWPWTVLLDARVRAGIRELGLDLFHAPGEVEPASVLFENACSWRGWPTPEPGQIEALLLDALAEPTARTRARARL